MLDELTDPDAPPSVRAWIAHPPDWIEVREAPASVNDDLQSPLDDGERAAISLAAAFYPELLLLMDDREGVLVAPKKGLTVTGTIGVLDMTAQRGLLDLAEAFHAASKHNVSLSRRNHDPSRRFTEAARPVRSFLRTLQTIRQQWRYEHLRLEWGHSDIQLLA